jgi:hypothetical protein
MQYFLSAQGQTRVAAALAALFATAFVVLAITGTTRMYSPVPFWDMWGATLGFYIAINDGASWLWWAQHNEHRILLSRLLFWLDYRFFGGLSVFLLVMNYVIVALAVLLFYYISRARMAHEPARRHIVFFTTCFMTAWLYQWMQHENLAWAFQSQFFLAQLLPLCALYVLHKSALNDKATLTFAAACLLGVASAGTMANGILALPLMTAYAIVTRMRLWQTLALAALTAVTLGLYFVDYTSPGHHGSVTDALLQQPLQLALYVAIYLGTPFFYLFGEATSGYIAAVISTAVMAAIAFTCLFQGLRNPRDNALKLALVFCVIYLAGTALGTGGGRLIFGIAQAASYRYTTPALMAWACTLILALPWFWRALRHYPRTGAGIVMFLLLLMLMQQFDAARGQHALVANRNVAGLALELGVQDEVQIRNVYEMSAGLLSTAEVASQYDLTIFGIYPWRDLKQTLGQQTRLTGLPACRGHVDTVSDIDTDPAFIRVEGWLFNSDARVVPGLITITAADGRIAGYALTGLPRPDVADAIGSHAGLAGFRGYVSTEIANAAIIVSFDMERHHD